jgi:hypothetical protein
MEPSWESYLRSLKLNQPSITLERVSELMKEKYPGDYEIMEWYNPNRGVMDFRMKFADPRKEMLWVIANSS